MLVPLLVFGLGLAAATVGSIHAQFQKQLIQRVRMHAEMAANGVNYAAEMASQNGLQRIVTALGAEEGISLIVVVGGNPARVLAATRSAWLGQPLTALPAKEVGEDLQQAIQTRQNQHRFRADAHTFDFTAPILLTQPGPADSSLVDGAVMVHFDMRPAQAAMRQLTLKFSLAALASLALLGGLGYGLIHHFLLHPIARIGQLIGQHRKGAHGNWDAADTHDELGALAGTLNDSLTRADALIRQLESQDAALHESERRFRVLFEQAAVGVSQICSDTGRFVRINQKYCDLLGRSRAEMERIDFQTITHPDDLAEDLANMERLKAGKTREFSMDKRYVRNDGSPVWVNLTVSPMWATGESPSFHIAVVKDITARKRAEAELQRVNRALRLISLFNQELVRAKTEASLLQVTCQFAVQFGGYRLAWVGYAEPDAPKSVWSVASAGLDEGYLDSLNLSWDDVPRGRGPTGTAIRTGRTAIARNILADPAFEPWRADALQRGFGSSIVLPLKDGGHCFGALNLYAAEADAFDAEEVKLLEELAGDLAYGIVVLRQRAECAAAEQKNRLQTTALNAADNPILITDREGTVEWVNPAFTRLSGYTSEESIGKNPRELVSSGKQSRDFYKEMWDTILSGQVWRNTLVNRRKDGSVYTEEETITPVTDAQGKITHFIAIKEDVSQRLLLEEQLRQSQKMESVGVLAGGVAHEFNNLLGVIMGNTSFLQMNGTSAEEQQQALEEIARAAERAAGLTRQLLAFGRKSMMQVKPLDLNEAVTHGVQLLQRIIGEGIALQTSLLPGGAPVLADPGMMDQVLMNLAVNARDAMPRGGRIDISLQNITLDLNAAERHPGLKPGDFIRLSIQDTGTGIAPEVLPLIFEPFFTTKDVGEGTGLGLSMVYGILKQHHGWIEVASKPGQGTVFHVHLPRLTAKPKSATTEETGAS